MLYRVDIIYRGSYIVQADDEDLEAEEGLKEANNDRFITFDEDCIENVEQVND